MKTGERLYFYTAALLSVSICAVWLLPFRQDASEKLSAFEAALYTGAPIISVLVYFVCVLNFMGLAYFTLRALVPRLFRRGTGGSHLFCLLNLFMVGALIVANRRYFAMLELEVPPFNSWWLVYVGASMILLLYGLFRSIAARFSS